MKQRLIEFAKRHRKPLLILATLATLAFLTVVTWRQAAPDAANPSASELSAQTDEGGDLGADDVDEALPTLAFTGRERLTAAVGRDYSARAAEAIERVVMAPDELAAAPHVNQPIDGQPANYYTATIDTASFRAVAGSPQWAYQFDITLTDGRSYQVWIKTGGDEVAEYVATAVASTVTGRRYLVLSLSDYQSPDEPLAWARDVLGFNEGSYTRLEAIQPGADD
jgi:hypothetical protein